MLNSGYLFSGLQLFYESHISLKRKWICEASFSAGLSGGIFVAVYSELHESHEEHFLK